MNDRLNVLALLDQWASKYYSHEWIRKNILKQTDDDIAEIDKQIADEAENAQLHPELLAPQMGMDLEPTTGPTNEPIPQAGPLMQPPDLNLPRRTGIHYTQDKPLMGKPSAGMGGVKTAMSQNKSLNNLDLRQEMITLYIKTHRQTGLKYFGKTTEDDPITYKGSGKHWLRHLIKYGYECDTEIYLQSEDQEYVTQEALRFSRVYDIVNSDLWAKSQGRKWLRCMDKRHKTARKFNQKTRKEKTAAFY